MTARSASVIPLFFARASAAVSWRPGPPTGRKLGSLPPAESEALSGMLTGGAGRLRGHIAALVPRPRLVGPGRIHILVTGLG